MQDRQGFGTIGAPPPPIHFCVFGCSVAAGLALHWEIALSRAGGVATQVARSIRHVPSSRNHLSDHHVHEDDEEEDGGVRVEAGLRV